MTSGCHVPSLQHVELLIMALSKHTPSLFSWFSLFFFYLPKKVFFFSVLFTDFSSLQLPFQFFKILFSLFSFY